MAAVPRVRSVDVRALPADACLLDVREDEEWVLGHAPGADHLPMSELVSRVAEVPRTTTVHVVCRVGSRSAQVVAWLVSQGFDAVNVEGGMTAWAAAGRPVLTDGGTAGRVA